MGNFGSTNTKDDKLNKAVMNAMETSESKNVNEKEIRRSENIKNENYKNKYVGNSENYSPTSSEPVPNVTMSTTSPRPSNGNMSTTSPGPVPTGSMSTTSADVDSATSARSVPINAPMSATSPAPTRNQMLGGNNIVTLDPSIFLTSEAEFNGGYTYASNLSESQIDYSPYTGGEPKHIIKLDPSIFESSEVQLGGQSSVASVAVSEFNPEKFFKEMQVGGLHEPRNKQPKKKHLDKYLSPEEDDDFEDEDKLSFAETTDGLDIDENEDTEDLKHKVKQLKMMVARSSGKKSKKSKKSKAKRMSPTEEVSESTGGANSISEYVNSTSSISTSDVRLISMNKMRKH